MELGSGSNSGPAADAAANDATAAIQELTALSSAAEKKRDARLDEMRQALLQAIAQMPQQLAEVAPPASNNNNAQPLLRELSKTGEESSRQLLEQLDAAVVELRSGASQTEKRLVARMDELRLAVLSTPPPAPAAPLPPSHAHAHPASDPSSLLASPAMAAAAWADAQQLQQVVPLVRESSRQVREQLEASVTDLRVELSAHTSRLEKRLLERLEDLRLAMPPAAPLGPAIIEPVLAQLREASTKNAEALRTLHERLEDTMASSSTSLRDSLLDRLATSSAASSAALASAAAAAEESSRAGMAQAALLAQGQEQVLVAHVAEASSRSAERVGLLHEHLEALSARNEQGLRALHQHVDTASTLVRDAILEQLRASSASAAATAAAASEAASISAEESSRAGVALAQAQQQALERLESLRSAMPPAAPVVAEILQPILAQLREAATNTSQDLKALHEHIDETTAAARTASASAHASANERLTALQAHFDASASSSRDLTAQGLRELQQHVSLDVRDHLLQALEAASSASAAASTSAAEQAAQTAQTQQQSLLLHEQSMAQSLSHIQQGLHDNDQRLQQLHRSVHANDEKLGNSLVELQESILAALDDLPQPAPTPAPAAAAAPAVPLPADYTPQFLALGQQLEEVSGSLRADHASSLTIAEQRLAARLDQVAHSVSALEASQAQSLTLAQSLALAQSAQAQDAAQLQTLSDKADERARQVASEVQQSVQQSVRENTERLETSLAQLQESVLAALADLPMPTPMPTPMPMAEDQASSSVAALPAVAASAVPEPVLVVAAPDYSGQFRALSQQLEEVASALRASHAATSTHAQSQSQFEELLETRMDRVGTLLQASQAQLQALAQAQQAQEPFLVSQLQTLAKKSDDRARALTEQLETSSAETRAELKRKVDHSARALSEHADSLATQHAHKVDEAVRALFASHRDQAAEAARARAVESKRIVTAITDQLGLLLDSQTAQSNLLARAATKEQQEAAQALLDASRVSSEQQGATQALLHALSSQIAQAEANLSTGASTADSALCARLDSVRSLVESLEHGDAQHRAFESRCAVALEEVCGGLGCLSASASESLQRSLSLEALSQRASALQQEHDELFAIFAEQLHGLAKGQEQALAYLANPPVPQSSPDVPSPATALQLQEQQEQHAHFQAQLQAQIQALKDQLESNTHALTTLTLATAPLKKEEDDEEEAKAKEEEEEAKPSVDPTWLSERLALLQLKLDDLLSRKPAPVVQPALRPMFVSATWEDQSKSQQEHFSSSATSASAPHHRGHPRHASVEHPLSLSHSSVEHSSVDLQELQHMHQGGMGGLSSPSSGSGGGGGGGSARHAPRHIVHHELPLHASPLSSELVHHVGLPFAVMHSTTLEATDADADADMLVEQVKEEGAAATAAPTAATTTSAPMKSAPSQQQQQQQQRAFSQQQQQQAYLQAQQDADERDLQSSAAVLDNIWQLLRRIVSDAVIAHTLPTGLPRSSGSALRHALVIHPADRAQLWALIAMLPLSVRERVEFVIRAFGRGPFGDAAADEAEEQQQQQPQEEEHKGQESQALVPHGSNNNGALRQRPLANPKSMLIDAVQDVHEALARYRPAAVAAAAAAEGRAGGAGVRCRPRQLMLWLFGLLFTGLIGGVVLVPGCGGPSEETLRLSGLRSSGHGAWGLHG